MSFNEVICDFSNNPPNSIIFSNDNMEGSMLEKNINNEIFIIKNNLNFKSANEMEASFDVNGLMFGYQLDGYCEYKSKNSSYNTKLSSGESNIQLLKNTNSVACIPKGKINTFGIIIKKEYIQNNIYDNSIKDLILSSLEQDECEKLIFEKKTNNYINLILKEIFTTPFNESLHNIYLQSKILEIIFHEFYELSKEKKIWEKTIKLDEYDIEALKKAKEILINNMQNPPGIIELAKLVRINEFKLKVGFKKLFGNTPHNLLFDYKMDIAKKLLLKSNMNISEIANHLGYKYSANFTTAFTRKYDIKPIDLIKTRKYYY